MRSQNPHKTELLSFVKTGSPWIIWSKLSLFDNHIMHTQKAQSSAVWKHNKQQCIGTVPTD